MVKRALPWPISAVHRHPEQGCRQRQRPRAVMKAAAQSPVLFLWHLRLFETISQAPSLAGHCLLPALRPACSAGYSLPDSPCGFCANYPHSRLCGIHRKNRMASPIAPTNSQKTSTWAFWRQVPDLYGVADGARTHDNRNHNPGLYQLSYSHRSLGL